MCSDDIYPADKNAYDQRQEYVKITYRVQLQVIDIYLVDNYLKYQHRCRKYHYGAEVCLFKVCP